MAQVKTHEDKDVQEALHKGDSLPSGTVFDPYGNVEDPAAWLAAREERHGKVAAERTAKRAARRESHQAPPEG